MSLSAFLTETARWVEAELDRVLPPVDVEPRRLHEAMRYAIFAGGKRLRPAIVRAACHAVGGADVDASSSACALEMLHTYSLIHDDLPAIDNDDLRRGRPTVHKQYDDATAILAGDALQTESFRVLAEETARPVAIVPLVRALAQAAGSAGMVGGEIADIEAEGQEAVLERVLAIHEKKTAALFRASAVMGGVAAEASVEQLAALDEYGTHLGLAFQIVDDILDETGDAETLGKTPGKDRAAGKMTLPACVGIEKSREYADEHASAAQRALKELPGGEILQELLDLTVERSR